MGQQTKFCSQQCNGQNYYILKGRKIVKKGLCFTCRKPITQNHRTKFCSKDCYRIQNAIENKVIAQRWAKNNRDKKNASAREWQRSNRSKALAMGNAWRRANPKRVQASKHRARVKQKNDPRYQLTDCLRNRIYDALKCQNVGKRESTMQLVGISIEALWRYLESKFKPGMTRKNYGSVWHVDHIRPCASFDLTDPAQQKQCFHYTNLQPLFATENIRKSSRWNGMLIRKNNIANIPADKLQNTPINATIDRIEPLEVNALYDN